MGNNNPGGGGGGGRGGGGARKPYANAALWLRNGASGAHEYRLYQGLTTLGRDPAEVDIVIDDEDVSRDHAHIQERSGHFAISDRGSTNGTSVNGKYIRGLTYLADNDEIRLGPGVSLTFKQL